MMAVIGLTLPTKEEGETGRVPVCAAASDANVD
jgi:hypothetical protein